MKLAITIIALMASIIVLPAMAETAQYWSDQANGYFISGDFEKAAASYDKALELEPNSTALWNNKGKALANLGRFDDAISCFRKSLDINASNLESMNLEAIALSQGLGENSQSVAIFDQILQISPSYYDALIGKGMALANEGDYSGSMSCFDAATQARPRDPSGWNNKGVVLREMGRYQDALTCFSRAIDLDYNYETARQNREMTLQDLNGEQSTSPSMSTDNML
jgi:tetratricopeptide (TPR) repeat protein